MEKANLTRVRPVSAQPVGKLNPTAPAHAEELPPQFDASLAHGADAVAAMAEIADAMAEIRQEAKTINLATLRAAHEEQRRHASRLAAEEVNRLVASSTAKHAGNLTAVHYDLATLALTKLSASAQNDDPITGYVERTIGIQALKHLQLALFCTGKDGQK